MKESRLVREVVRVGFWLVGVLCLSSIAAAEDHPAFQPVKELFAAMSKHDGKAMHEQATEDFQLLEHGKEDDRWKVQLLHSTRVDSDKQPKDIEWIQFESKL